MVIQRAVQQIMLGTVTKDEEHTRFLLSQLKQFGYTGLELNRFMIHPTPLMVRLLTKMAKMPTGNSGKLNWPKLVQEANLDVVSLHTDLASLEQHFEEVLLDVEALKTSRVVINGMYRFNYQDEVAVRNLAKRLNVVGKQLQEKGINLFYHNHNIELLHVNEDKSAYDTLIENTDPSYVNFECDTYWIAEAGMNPLSMMEKLGNRMKLWHIADRGTRVSKTPMTPILNSDSVELGQGNMDLDALSAYAKKVGIEAVVLESHRNWIHKDPIESIKLSSTYLLKEFGGER